MPPKTKGPTVLTSGLSERPRINALTPGGANADRRSTASQHAQISERRSVTEKKRRQSTDSKRRASVSTEELFTAAALQEQAEQILDQASSIEKTAASAASSLELKLGRELSKQTMTVPEMIRKWDANGDGEISKIEFRQVVRNILKIKADNKEVDELFDRLDGDGGGSLDPKEMAIALKLFQDNVASAEADESAQQRLAVELRGEAALLLECAKVTADLESYLARIMALRDGVYEGSLESQVCAMIVSRSKFTSENDQRQRVIHGWRGESSKADHVSFEAFHAFVLGFVSDPAAVVAAESEAFYEALMKGTRTKPLDVKLGVKKLWEGVDAIKEEELGMGIAAEKMRSAVRKQQKATKEAQQARLARDAEKEEAARRERDEKAAAAAAKKEAKAAEKAAKAAQKQKEEASFVRRVERRRSIPSVTATVASSQMMDLAKIADQAQKAAAAAQREQEAKLRKAFAVFDADGDGYLSVDELKAVLLRGSSALTADDVETLVKEFDVNGDGVLEFDEFTPLWEDVLGDLDDVVGIAQPVRKARPQTLW
mmetsp:Transcript_49027/g.127984  ORF Transcript_49027/g.127984 Transcript_49027/m.127984 type:complete len:545 (+) Transcript_49027:159-1793(+)